MSVNLGNGWRVKMKAAIITLILLIALVSVIAIIGLAALWFGGGKIVFIPGLQIVITTRLLIALFASVAILMLGFAFLVWRAS